MNHSVCEGMHLALSRTEFTRQCHSMKGMLCLVITRHSQFSHSTDRIFISGEEEGLLLESVWQHCSYNGLWLYTGSQIIIMSLLAENCTHTL